MTVDAATLSRLGQQFLGQLAAGQQELLALLQRKAPLLAHGDTAGLEALAVQEQELTQRLNGLIGLRQKLLKTAGHAGWQADSISDLLRQVSGADWPKLSQAVQQVQELCERVRRESWVQWIVAHRCYRHYSELRDLIAQRGELVPGYSRRMEQSGGSGGAVLDASV